MEFVNYDRFENVKLIAEGGFSKIYKATWMDGPISRWNEKQQNYRHDGEMIVALKELDNSKNINSKELNEVKLAMMSFNCNACSNINDLFLI